MTLKKLWNMFSGKTKDIGVTNNKYKEVLESNLNLNDVYVVMNLNDLKNYIMIVTKSNVYIANIYTGICEVVEMSDELLSQFEFTRCRDKDRLFPTIFYTFKYINSYENLPINKGETKYVLHNDDIEQVVTVTN